MNPMDQFKATYFTEAAELLEEMEQCLLAIEAGVQQAGTMDALFRAVHSIKGGALAFGFEKISCFTHVVETLLDELRGGEITLSSPLMDGLLKARDSIEGMLDAARNETPIADDFGADVLALLSHTMLPHTVAAETVPEVAAVTYDIHFAPQPELFLTGNEPLRIFAELRGLGALTITADTSQLPTLAELDPTLCYLRWEMQLKTTADEASVREVFEFVEHISTLSIHKRSAAIEAMPTEESSIKTGASSTMRVEAEKVDRLMNMVGELVIAQSMLSAQCSSLGADMESLALRTRELQEAVMAIRMQPVKSLFSRMPRMVRDTAQQLGKQVELVVEGEQTELDKAVIEKLADPLSHMLRNAIDHGIELPEIRASQGKPAQGRVELRAFARSGRIFIELRDDGAGLNRERILAKARAAGLVDASRELSDSEIDALIFHAGLSTAASVTNLSGRGVGMDVVRRNIESIGGAVWVENTPERGTVFTLSLPLTLASLDGMVVRVGAEYYVIPTASILESLRPAPSDLRRLNAGCDLLQVRGECIRLVPLHRLFAVRGAIADPSQALVVLVEQGNQKIGLQVDELLGQQQVVVKTIATCSHAMRGFSGTTILGDGRVSLILEINDLLAASTAISPTPRQVA